MAVLDAEGTSLSPGLAPLDLTARLREKVAEAVGLTTEASRFSENMQNHFMYGDNVRLPEHIKALGGTA